MGIGSILLERGLINDEQLAEAIDEQNRTGERLDHLLVRLGHVSGAQVLEAIGQQFAMPIVDLASLEVPAETLKLCSIAQMASRPSFTAPPGPARRPPHLQPLRHRALRCHL